MKAYSPSCSRPHSSPPTSRGGSASVIAALREGFKRGFYSQGTEWSRAGRSCNEWGSGETSQKGIAWGEWEREGKEKGRPGRQHIQSNLAQVAHNTAKRRFELSTNRYKSMPGQGSRGEGKGELYHQNGRSTQEHARKMRCARAGNSRTCEQDRGASR